MVALPNWNVALQDAAAPYIATWAQRLDVPLEIAFALVATESSFKPTAYRFEPRINDASYGLVQILYRTAQGLGYQGPATGLYDPDTNVQLGLRYLRSMFDRFGTWEQAISAYNEGPATATIGNPDYVAKVLDRAAYFTNAWGLNAPPDDLEEWPVVLDDTGGPGWGLALAGLGLAALLGVGFIRGASRRSV